MRFGIEEGILLTDLDAKGRDILNCPYLESEDTISTLDSRMYDPRTPPAGSVTNESVAKDAAIAQHKLAFVDPIPGEWLGTDSGLAAPGELVERISNKNAINGYVGLGTDGKMPPGTVPVAGSGTVTEVKFAFPPEIIVNRKVLPSGPPPDGTPVDAWPDSSGAGRTATQTGAARPLYKTNVLNGHPVLRFNASALQFLNISVPIPNSDYTVFVVMRVTGAGTRGASIGVLGTGGLPEDGTYGPLHYLDDSVYVSSQGWSCRAPGPISREVFHIYTGVIPINVFAGEHVFIDGGDPAGQGIAGSTVAMPPLNVLGRRNTDYMNGDIAEIIVYNNAMTAGILFAEEREDTGETRPAEPRLPGDRIKIEAYLSAKYGIAVSGGGVAADPSTISGLIGWWKAESILTPASDTHTAQWAAAPPESWFGINPVSVGPGTPYPRFNRLPFPEDMIPALDASHVNSGTVAHDQLPPDTLLSTPGDGMEGHESDYYSRDGTYRPMKAASYQPVLPDPAITVASYQSGKALINLTSSTKGVTLFANSIPGDPDTFVEVTKQPLQAIPGKQLSVYSAKIGWSNSNIVTYEIPMSPLSGFDITLPPPL